MKEVAASLIAKGECRMARELYRVHAFDTRFNLYSDGKKCIYLLDVL